MVALSSMGNLLFVQSSKSFSSLSRSLQTLLCHYWGPRAVRGLHFSWSDFLYPGVLYLSSTVLWTAVVHTVYATSFTCMHLLFYFLVEETIWQSLDQCVLQPFVFLAGDRCGVLIGEKRQEISERGERLHCSTISRLHQAECIWLAWET